MNPVIGMKTCLIVPKYAGNQHLDTNAYIRNQHFSMSPRQKYELLDDALDSGRSCFFLSLFSIMGYLISCSFLGYAALTSPSFGTGVPKFLLGNIDPTFFLFFQFAVLFLAFDAGHLHNRNRIAEVLDSKSITNFEYLAGRVFGIAGLLWLVAAANICVMQILGLISITTNIGIADTIEWYSLINLLVIDGPATLLLWCSIVVFLSCVLHFRLLVAGVSSALIFGWFFPSLEHTVLAT